LVLIKVTIVLAEKIVLICIRGWTPQDI